MYVDVNGLGRLGRKGRKGFGDVSCPGDPSCPGYVAPASSDYQTSLLQEILANQAAAVPGTTPAAVVATPATSSLTTWFNANGTTVAIVAAIGLGVLLFAKAGR